jgi:hypothetical protein
VHIDNQPILSKHQVGFSTPQGLPSSCGVHDHSIPLVPGTLPPIVFPYRHPFSQNNEIKKIFQELLEAGVICPSRNPYSSHVVLVLNKEVTWGMCPNFCALNKITIKDKFPIFFMDDVLDELRVLSTLLKLIFVLATTIYV